MSTDGSFAAPARDGSAGLRAVASIGALLAAAALLALGVSVSERDADGPTNVAVVPGKVSVLADAKVREWQGQTFSIEVPLEWERTLSAVAEVQDGTQFQRHQWALLTAGDAATASKEDWLSAASAAKARLNVDIRRYADEFSAERWARDTADIKSAAPGYRFGDVGPIAIGAGPDGTGGRDGWRLNVAAADQLESHYFFVTCDGETPREAWHVTFNRESVADQQPALQSTLASLRTDYAGASRNGC